MQPRAYFQHITAIPFDFLSSRRIKGLLLDSDNTLCRQGAEEADPEVRSWLSQAQEHGIKLCIVSNGSAQRSEKIADTLNIPFIARAGKPSKRGFEKALDILELEPSAAAVIGDQLFTDMLGAQRMGMYSILVEPLDRKNEPFVIKIKRPFERLLLAKDPKEGELL